MSILIEGLKKMNSVIHKLFIKELDDRDFLLTLDNVIGVKIFLYQLINDTPKLC